MQSFVKLVNKLFPVLVLVAAAIAYLMPEPIKPAGKYIAYLLGIVMMGMGLTMTPGDFKLIVKRPKDVLLGVVLRTVIMPTVAFCIAKLLSLPPYLAAGLILVGCCPSGTSSNVMTFISKGDTPLSITLTAVITLLAPITTPYIFLLLAGTFIPINAYAMFKSILIVVLFPVAAGIFIRVVAARFVEKVMPIVPLISITAIIIIVAAVVAGSANRLASVALVAFVAVALHNGLGYFLGYMVSRFVKLSPRKAKAITFEVGMENSGLAVALAMAHLNPMAAIPGAIFSVWHNFTGSVLAGYWSNREDAEEAAPEQAVGAEAS
ncbi:bile acid:sodium symporter family protein [Desulfocurvus sp. DL9XJH121]